MKNSGRAVRGLLILLLLFSGISIILHIAIRKQKRDNTSKRVIPEHDNAHDRDQELIRKIRLAIDEAASPTMIEKMVGVEAALNTTQRYHRSQLERAAIVVDPELKLALPNLKDEAAVLFWIRPVRTHFPKIVGVTWKKNGETGLFFAELLDPSM